MGFLLVVAVLFLAVMVGRFSVQVHKYQQVCEELSSRCDVLQHGLDNVESQVSHMLWAGSVSVDQLRSSSDLDQ